MKRTEQDELMIQEICLMRGFTKDLAGQALQKLAEEGGEYSTSFAPMTDEMRDMKMEPLLESLFEGKAPGGNPLREGHRVVIMAVSSQQRAVTIMRAVKSVSPDPHDIVFAMVTQTALGWTLQHYIDHVSEEHEYMKTHNPAEDPDMKKI
ncbi:MAG: DUF3783 domain-containing protein [Spirochaetales bacterium]|nr:DUF3783 domain-containing protein [Spirochaetales bacterium]